MTRITRRLLVVTLTAGTVLAGSVGTSVAAPDHTRPGPVHGIAAKAFANRVLLTWKNPDTPDLATVLIRRNVGSFAPRTPTAGAFVKRIATPVHRFTDRNLSPATLYTYAFFTVDSHHNIGHRMIKRVMTAPDQTAPHAVTITKVTPREQSISLSWTLPADRDALKVTVVRKEGSETPQNIDDGLQVKQTGPATRYTDNGLAEDTLYAYTVFTTDAAGNVSAARASNSRATGTLPDTTPPAPVTALTAVKGPMSSVRLHWTNPADPDSVGEVVVRALGSTPPSTIDDGVTVAQLTPETSAFAEFSLMSETSYSYWVYTFDQAGNKSEPQSVNVTTGDSIQPGPVTSVHVDATGPTTIQLSWVNPADSDFDHIVIRRGDFNAFPAAPTEGGSLVATVGPDVTTVIDAGVAPGQLYAYAIFTVDTSGNYLATNVFGSTL